MEVKTKPKRSTIKNLAVFISGQGSNLEIILGNKEKFNKIIVVSSKANAFGLQRAEQHGVDSLVLANPIDWDALQIALEEQNIDGIFLAGFMKILPAPFIEKWTGALFNLHPSLLPKFKGLKAIEKAYAAGEDIGVSIHHVTPEVDSGEILFQELAVSAKQLEYLSLNETIERTHQKEHELVQRWVDSWTQP